MGDPYDPYKREDNTPKTLGRPQVSMPCCCYTYLTGVTFYFYECGGSNQGGSAGDASWTSYGSGGGVTSGGSTSSGGTSSGGGSTSTGTTGWTAIADDGSSTGTQVDEVGDDNSGPGDISSVLGDPIPGYDNAPDANGNYFDVAGNQLDNIFKIQNSIVNEWKGTRIFSETSNQRKGNFGEMASDVALQKKGYTPLHNRLTNIDAGTHLGIDAVFKKTNGGSTTYYIVEGKWGNGEPNKGTRPPQMSDAWINGKLQGQPLTRLEQAVGTPMAKTIGYNYVRLLANIDFNGNVKYTKLDAGGNVIDGAAGVFIP